MDAAKTNESNEAGTAACSRTRWFDRRYPWVVLAYTAISIALLHPLPISLMGSLGSALENSPDSYAYHLSTPTLGHDEDTLVMSTTLQLKSKDVLSLEWSNYGEHLIFYPYRGVMFMSELLVPQVLFASPLISAGLSPHFVHDLLLWLSFPACAFVMFALAVTRVFVDVMFDVLAALVRTTMLMQAPL